MAIGFGPNAFPGTESSYACGMSQTDLMALLREEPGHSITESARGFQTHVNALDALSPCCDWAKPSGLVAVKAHGVPPGMFQAHIQGPFGHVNPQWGRLVLCIAPVMIPRAPPQVRPQDTITFPSRMETLR